MNGAASPPWQYPQVPAQPVQELLTLSVPLEEFVVRVGPSE